ncbi:hypothetical protein A3A14_00285 [Candidatus Daviesbacteria bacterium RIFCSPLOWO2_01_FULL_43_38]|uniref:Transposase IS200-like domain-containing protein n=3 Tax=Candidatus Daviesiibacteriota TaxID=1752718 RepID=A0A1F5K7B6_9BACT|nr:MAG: hypothetical protein UV33_C0041G0003 [Candidatus Daviesbacteria bacterium GW2011_GWA1_42_6]KKS69257.1 MAG: hypothetical protein UV41_C0059G0001 [Candidatus Daviesbacteria bacterium GW2011_GWA2_42_7]OGE20286.1 MAG: hypothetical protein A2874_03880 [Candidatus Daviesbacteria bacterium RIFCSPHIGHO2_01_FULL_43_17]OGE36650.1 MAG: hypothetical protein A3E45_02655 [Candidatus Daviesbacteria bacterium RIFCSPHIGHO2_12_FULL_43_11]OGE63224.1 MAG: hypothetical protein A3A14_00285 [Candidatus Davies
MPSRFTPLVNDEYYHVFNRGVNKLPIFNGVADYRRFIKTLKYYQVEGPKPRLSLFMPMTTKLDWDKKIVEVICYCLMPNHFHLLLKQVKDGGITEFVGNLSNSYTRYYNTRHRRVGPILQGEFKSVLVESNEQLLHLSRYIHLNPLVSGFTKDLDSYQWSSYPEYLGLLPTGFCSMGIILDQFKTLLDYKKFVLDQASYGMELEFIKHHLLDIED